MPELTPHQNLEESSNSTNLVRNSDESYLPLKRGLIPTHEGNEGQMTNLKFKLIEPTIYSGLANEKCNNFSTGFNPW